MGRYRWVVLGAGVTAQAAYSALATGVAVLVPDLRAEYGLSLGQVGVLLAAASGGMVLTLIAWGLLTDKVGERAVVALGLSVSGLAFLAASTLPAYAVVFGLVTLAGMAGASVSAASGRAVMGWFAADERGFALGIRQTAVPLGWAIAALALPPIVHAGGLSARLAALRIRGPVGAVGGGGGAPGVGGRGGGGGGGPPPPRPAGFRRCRSRPGAATRRPAALAALRGQHLLRRRADRADELRRRLPPRRARLLGRRGGR